MGRANEMDSGRSGCVSNAKARILDTERVVEVLAVEEE
jgi:hypothetical protein